jgi:hypothetical protein
VSEQQPEPGWRQGPDGRWYPEASRKPSDEERRPRSTLLELLKAAPLIVKLLLAIFGGGITIVIVIVIGNTAASHGPNSYPASLQQQWLNACESLSFNTPPVCECELDYFERNATPQQFATYYGENGNPGVVPPQLQDALTCEN